MEKNSNFNRWLPYTKLVSFNLVLCFQCGAGSGFLRLRALYGRGSYLTMADYWRWLVAHLWVESIFEFFGVAVIALLTVTMGLATATLRVAYFIASITFISGIIGTAQHYLFNQLTG